MKSSAKVTLSILIAAALGAVGFACTVGGGTSDDFDGGTSSSTSSSSGTSGTSGTTTSSSSGGVDAGVCTQWTTQASYKFEPESCNTCLKEKCCTQVAECYNILDEPDAGPVGCDTYAECLQSCDATTPGDKAKIDQCIIDICDSTANTKVPPAHAAFASCRDTNCPTCP